MLETGHKVRKLPIQCREELPIVIVRNISQKREEGNNLVDGAMLNRDSQFSPQNGSSVLSNRHGNPNLQNSRKYNRPQTALSPQKSQQPFDSSSYSNHNQQLVIQPMLQRMMEQIKVVKEFAKSQSGQDYIKKLHLKHLKDSEMPKEPKFVNISKNVSRNLNNIIQDPKAAASLASNKMIDDIQNRIKNFNQSSTVQNLNSAGSLNTAEQQRKFKFGIGLTHLRKQSDKDSKRVNKNDESDDAMPGVQGKLMINYTSMKSLNTNNQNHLHQKMSAQSQITEQKQLFKNTLDDGLQKHTIDFRINKPRKQGQINHNNQYIYPSKINIDHSILDDSDISDELMNQQQKSNENNQSSQNRQLDQIQNQINNRSFTNIYGDDKDQDNLNLSSSLAQHNYNRSATSMNILQRSSTFHQLEESKKNRVIIQSKIQIQNGETKLLNIQYQKADTMTFSNMNNNTETYPNGNYDFLGGTGTQTLNHMETPELSRGLSFINKLDTEDTLNMNLLTTNTKRNACIQSSNNLMEQNKDNHKTGLNGNNQYLYRQTSNNKINQQKRPFTPEKWAIQQAIMINFSEQNLQTILKNCQPSLYQNRDRRVFKVMRNEKQQSQINLDQKQNQEKPSKNRIQLSLYDKPEFIINGKLQIDSKGRAIEKSKVACDNPTKQDNNQNPKAQKKSRNRLINSQRHYSAAIHISNKNSQSPFTKRPKSKLKHKLVDINSSSSKYLLSRGGTAEKVVEIIDESGTNRIINIQNLDQSPVPN
eukprot:403352866